MPKPEPALKAHFMFQLNPIDNCNITPFHVSVSASSRLLGRDHIGSGAHRGLTSRGETMMKAILSALLAVSVLAGATLAASAADEYDYPSDVFKKIERNLP
jgi:hypothetical protein